MSERADACRRRANDCELAASRMKDQEVRTVYLDMAARWRRMAGSRKLSTTSWGTCERRQKWGVTKPEDQRVIGDQTPIWQAKAAQYGPGVLRAFSPAPDKWAKILHGHRPCCAALHRRTDLRGLLAGVWCNVSARIKRRRTERRH